jgi:nucleoside-diphosphate-sugar epimerase
VKSALVTGSAGFIGRHVHATLEDDGWDVTAIDVVDGHGNEDVREYFRYGTPQFELVVHAAAVVGGRANIESRQTHLGAVNLQLDGALFEWALRCRPRHLVYLSSSAVYPIKYQLRGAEPLKEWYVDLAGPGLPDATYGWVKLTGERLAAEYREESADGCRVHVVRPFSGYGTDQDTTYPFGAFRLRARDRVNPFRIWGDGTQVRDWVHVDDVVGAILAVVREDVCDPVNVCTGRGTTFDELAGLFTSVVGYDPELYHAVDLPSGVLHRVGDPTRMCQFYEPRVTLEEGVARALRA